MSDPADPPMPGAGDDDAERRRGKAAREFAESSQVEPPAHDRPDGESGAGGDTDPETPTRPAT